MLEPVSVASSCPCHAVLPLWYRAETDDDTVCMDLLTLEEYAMGILKDGDVKEDREETEILDCLRPLAKVPTGCHRLALEVSAGLRACLQRAGRITQSPPFTQIRFHLSPTRERKFTVLGFVARDVATVCKIRTKDAG